MYGGATQFRLLLALSIGCLSFTACGLWPRVEDVPTVRIDFSKRIAAPAESFSSAGRPLRIALAGITSPAATLHRYEDLLDYIGKKLGSPLEVKQHRTYEEINKSLADGDLDVGFLCSGGYVLAGRSLASQILAVPVIHGKTSYQAYIIVPRESPIREFSELRGHSFAFTDPLSNTGWLYPVSKLADLRATPSSFFSGVSFTYAHDLSIQAVAYKISDGASVHAGVYEDLARSSPELIGRVRIIERSPDFGMPPVVASPKLDRSAKERIRLVLTTMHRDVEGSRVLAKLAYDGFVKGDERDYESIRQMARRVGQLRP